jgi:hypothetical protein
LCGDLDDVSPHRVHPPNPYIRGTKNNMVKAKTEVKEVEITTEVVKETKLNDKQKEYLAFLESYKTQNPVKYEIKKDVLLAKLNEIK